MFLISDNLEQFIFFILEQSSTFKNDVGHFDYFFFLKTFFCKGLRDIFTYHKTKFLFGALVITIYTRLHAQGHRPHKVMRSYYR